MKIRFRALLAAALAAALVASLTGCAFLFPKWPTGTPGATTSPEPTAITPGLTPEPTAITPGLTPEATASPEPTADPGWWIPDDRTGLTDAQKAVYDEIETSTLPVPPAAEYYFNDGTWIVDVRLEAAFEGEPGHFFLSHSGFLVDATNVTLFAGTKSWLLEAAGDDLFVGNVDVAALWAKDQLRLDFTLGGEAKSLAIDRVPDSSLTQDQVLLLMCVDPDATARYFLGDATRHYYIFYYVLANDDPALHGLHMGWNLEVRPENSTGDDSSWFNVLEYPRSIEPLAP